MYIKEIGNILLTVSNQNLAENINGNPSGTTTSPTPGSPIIGNETGGSRTPIEPKRGTSTPVVIAPQPVTPKPTSPTITRQNRTSNPDGLQIS